MYKRTSRIALVGLVFFSLNTSAQQKVNSVLPASKSSFIHIEHQYGYADIRGWDNQQVKVEGTLGDKTEDFIFKETNSGIQLKVEVKRSGRGNWQDWSDENADNLIIYVPFGSNVEYESINANLTMNDLSGLTEAELINGSIHGIGLSGRVRIESVNGSVQFDNTSGDISIETVNGNVKGTHIDKQDLSVETVNGTIDVSSNSNDVNAASVNGNIELALSDVTSLEFSSVNGNIDVALSLNENGEVQGSTVGGRIALMFEKPVSARFDIEAHAGGKITNTITNDKMQKAKYGPRRWLNFTAGQGSAVVDLSTVNGKIDLDTKR